MVSAREKRKKVCVIGAGASGLVAARELRREGHQVVVIEQNADVGGQWLYQADVSGEDPLGREPVRVHSSIYESLRLVSPREIMGFTDFPFVSVLERKNDARRFPGHRELLRYLRGFCERFGLRECIRFSTRVGYVGRVGFVGDGMEWNVRSEKVGEDVVAEEGFDAVVVATGHYSQPRLSHVQGMDTWRRKQIHSHMYRVPNPYCGEVVVVIGNSLSGQDISMELVKVAKEVYLSAKSLDVSEGLSKFISKHANFHIFPQVHALEQDGSVYFIDGSSIIADAIIYCTGYSYSFPFLDTEGIVTTDDDRVGPLYEHTFPPYLAPSLSFVGIPRKLIGFPFFESQAKWIAQVLSGKRTLPSCDAMMMSTKEFYRSKELAGIPKHNTHDIADFEYCDRYGDNVDFPPLEEWRKELCLRALKNAESNLETYRDEWDGDDLLKEAYQSAHFTQNGNEATPCNMDF